jgi:hypothetical protein
MDYGYLMYVVGIVWFVVTVVEVELPEYTPEYPTGAVM